MNDPDDLTDEMIETAILAALDHHAAATTPTDRPIAWSKVRTTVPGDPWRQTLALTRLWQDWRINLMNIDGQPYIWPADTDDHHDQARCTAAGLHRDTDAIIVL